MDALIALGNRAKIGKVTCGWKLPYLILGPVFRYWRDLDSLSSARRQGIWEPRHFQFDPAISLAAPATAGIAMECPTDEQLLWVSDIRDVADEAVLARPMAPRSGETGVHVACSFASRGLCV